MKKILVTALLAAIAMPLAAADAEKKDGNISVNGKVITEPMFRYLIQDQIKPGQQVNPQMQQQLINEMIKIVLLSQDAEAKKLDKEKRYADGLAATLEMERMMYLSQAALQNTLSKTKITDKEIKALYDKKYSKPTKEYKARHILLKDEKTANDMIAQLKKGEDFEALAKKHSTGPTGPNGGDLGWFSTATMVKPFGDAVKTMKKGTTSDKPVKTQFGWHVIKLEDTKEVAARSYEEMKAGLTAEIRQNAVQDYIGSLYKKSDVKVVGKK